MGIIKLKYSAEQINKAIELLDKHELLINSMGDELGKITQTKEGNGTMEDPFKGWKPGTKVESGLWWLTDDGYLWEAIKSGIPESSTDKEYWDIP